MPRRPQADVRGKDAPGDAHIAATSRGARPNATEKAEAARIETNALFAAGGGGGRERKDAHEAAQPQLPAEAAPAPAGMNEPGQE